MCCKVYHYEDKNGCSIYLNATDSSKVDSELVLKLYIEWYNKEFAPFENLPKINISDYVFIDSFCPIDFYDETANFARSIKNA